MDINTSRKLTVLSFAFLCGLSGVWTDVNIPKPNVDVVKGKEVVLQASYNPPSSSMNKATVIWNLIRNNQPKQVISYAGGLIVMGDAQFEGRVGFTESMPSSNLSLFINDTRESDTGLYICQVINPNGVGQVNLEVKVPPSVPKCSVSNKPVLKGNVTLNCNSSTGQPTPQYKWVKTSGGAQGLFFPPMLNAKLGTLRLTNLTTNMSGKYMCTAQNSAGSETCVINLEISSSLSPGAIAGAVLGPVIFFIIVVLVLICVLVKKRRDAEDDMANDIKEDAQAPKRVSWAKSGMGSDIISKNGTMSSIGSSPHQKEPSHHHSHHQLHQYPQRPPSDTASIITGTGSYRPSRQQGASTPTHYSYNNSSTLPRGQSAPSERSTSGSPLPRTERSTPLPQAQPPPPQATLQSQAVPRPPPLPTSVVTASNISRMGGVPIMVPAQNQAGSLV